MIARFAFVLALALSTAALAQDASTPPGGGRVIRQGGSSSELPLSGGIDPTVRDYILYIINERSKASDQRFDAQQVANVVAFQAQEKAQGLALQSIKELTAAAFAAAKEAVTKQETSFDKQLQQSKTEADIRFKSVDDKLAILIAQMNTISGRDQGSSVTWNIFAIGIGLLIGLGGLLIGMREKRTHEYDDAERYRRLIDRKVADLPGSNGT